MSKKSKIQDIKIPIRNYTRSTKNTFPYFVGRHAQRAKLNDLLTSHESDSGGAYLVVGARGMGKTTLVNKVLADLNEREKSKYLEKIEISLSNENFEEIDIYRIIGKKFLTKFLDRYEKNKGNGTRIGILILYFFVLFAIPISFIKLSPIVNPNNLYQSFLDTLVYGLSVLGKFLRLELRSVQNTRTERIMPKSDNFRYDCPARMGDCP